eukprot:185721_1
MASRFQIIEELKNQTVLQREKLLQTLDLKYSYHVYHLLQQRYLIQQHIQKRYDLLIKYINSLHINEIDNINETDNTNDILLQRILGLIKSLDTDQPLPQNNLNQDIPIVDDPPHNEPYQPKSEVNTYTDLSSIVDQYQIRYPDVKSPQNYCYKSKPKRKKKPKLSEEEIKEWDNTKLSSLLAKDIRRLLLTRGAKKNQLVVKKSQLLELLKENYPVSLPMPYSELTRADLHSELRLRGLESKLKGKDKGKESLIKILNGETVTKTKKYTSPCKPYKSNRRLDPICAGCLEQCNARPTIKCARCFREYHTSCIGKGNICKLCLDKNADRRSKRLENKSANYTEIIPTPTSLIGVNLAKSNVPAWLISPKYARDEEYLPPKSHRKALQISGHKRLLQEINMMIPPGQYHHYHKVPSFEIKKRKLSMPPQSQLRAIPALIKNDVAMDDSKIADADLSWNLRKEGAFRGAIHNLVHGTQTFRKLPIKCKAIIGIALMNEIVRGSGSDSELKKFPMWHRPTVRDVLVAVGGGKPSQYPCSGVLLHGRVINVRNAGDKQLFGYLADSEVIELVKKNIINQQDIWKIPHCQQVIKWFENAMKSRIPTKKQLEEMKVSCRTPYVYQYHDYHHLNQGHNVTKVSGGMSGTEMNRPQQQQQMDGDMRNSMQPPDMRQQGNK